MAVNLSNLILKPQQQQAPVASAIPTPQAQSPTTMGGDFLGSLKNKISDLTNKLNGQQGQLPSFDIKPLIDTAKGFGQVLGLDKIGESLTQQAGMLQSINKDIGNINQINKSQEAVKSMGGQVSAMEFTDDDRNAFRELMGLPGMTEERAANLVISKRREVNLAKQPQQQQQPKKGLLSQFGEDVSEGFKGALTTVGGAISQVPEMAGNIAKVGTEYNPVLQAADRLQALITGERELPGLADTYQRQGNEAKRELQKKLGINGEDLKVKTGEFIAEMLPFFAGGGLVKGATSIPKVKQFIQTYPKLAKLMGTITAGGLGTEAYTAVSEGRPATAPELALGIATQGAFDAGLGVFNKIRSVIKPETEDLIMKGIKPRLLKGRESTQQMEKFKNNVISGFSSVVKNKENLKFTDEFGEEIVGQLPKNLNQAVQAVEQTQDNLFKQYDGILKSKGQNLTFNFDDIIGELEKLQGDKALQLASPSTKSYIDSVIKNYKDVGTISADELQKLKQGLNNKLKAYYQSPNPNELGNVLVDTLINNKLGDKLNNAIGPEYQALKQQYGALANIKNDLIHRATVEGRKGQAGLFDLANIFNAGDVISGLTSGNAGQLAKGTAQTFFTTLAKKLNSPDRNVKLLFERLDNELQSVPNWIKNIIPVDTKGAIQSKIKEKYQKGGVLEKGAKGFAVNPFSKGEKLPGVAKIPKEFKNNKEFLTLYHGTNQQFDKFIKEKFGKGAGSLQGEGVYLTDNPEVAKAYAKSMAGPYGDKNLITSTIDKNLKIKEIPYTYEYKNGGFTSLVEEAKKQGYDGVKFPVNNDYPNYYTVRKGDYEVNEPISIDTSKSNNYLIFDTKGVNIIRQQLLTQLGPLAGALTLYGMLQGNQQ